VRKLKRKLVSIECQKCNARTEYAVELPTPKNMKVAKKDSSAAKALANVSSDLHSPGQQLAEKAKKRARSRKSSSLQALLARSKAEAAGSKDTGFGLDLKDLLKGS